MTVATEALRRITYDPQVSRKEMATIPWPENLAPRPVDLSPSTNLPRCDVLCVTWTTAESQALADVMTPGRKTTEWASYTKDWTAYEPQLTARSPALESKNLARWSVTEIGDARVVVAKSSLHLATDAASAPIVQLLRQMVGDCRPKLVITTGTAGGIGASTQLGDVFVCTNAKFNCTQTFKTKPWAQERFTGPSRHKGPNAGLFSNLIAPNAGRLRPVATRDPQLTFGGDVETVDYFAFADTEDSYGVVANDPKAHTEEMDDACLPLALSTVEQPPEWCSIRNASDPQVPSSVGDLSAQKAWAEKIYQQYGYWTTIGSAIASWAVIADA
jgi:nucleoside phosphorylase